MTLSLVASNRYAGLPSAWGSNAPAADQRAEALLGHYQLSHAAALYPHELSGGMARRVLIAMAQVGNAHLVIADEPSVGLDPTQRDRVLATLKAMALEGKAVLLITHDLRHALPIADRVTVMRHGKGLETAPRQSVSGPRGTVNHRLCTRPLARACRITPSARCQSPPCDRSQRLLEAHGISFHFPSGLPLLKGVTLRLAPGEWIGLSGDSGAGKTTLGKLLAGQLAPPRGPSDH